MPPPNILFILADDLGWGDLSCHDAPIRTPNIDRLMADGIELGQHYVTPMCTPTRTALLTGRHPGRFGAHATVPSNAPVLPDGYPTLATVLRDAGYDTGLFGKWHLGSLPQFGPNHFGFNRSYGSLAGGVDPYNHHYKRGEYSVTWHSDGQLVENRGHVTDLIVGQALDWIESRDRPWFCYVPFTAVHAPIKPTQAWLDQYASQHFDEDRLKDASFKKYAAYASHMDHAVGRMVESPGGDGAAGRHHHRLLFRQRGHQRLPPPRFGLVPRVAGGAAQDWGPTSPCGASRPSSTRAASTRQR